MPKTIEQDYDQILLEINNRMSKIDPALALQTMYFERKFTDVEPQVELILHYKKTADLDQKKDLLSSKYGFMIAKEPHNTLRLIGLMTLSMIQQISIDEDIEAVYGTASCASY